MTISINGVQDFNCGEMFHGSNMEIDKVDLSKCMTNKDFGCGFYAALLEEQAW